MTDRLLIAVHTFTSRVSMSVSVDEVGVGGLMFIVDMLSPPKFDVK